MLFSIVKDAFWMGTFEHKMSETIEGFHKKDIALAVVQVLAEQECVRLNNGSNAGVFIYTDKSEEYDVVVVLPLCGQYHVITGYKVVEADSQGF